MGHPNGGQGNKDNISLAYFCMFINIVSKYALMKSKYSNVKSKFKIRNGVYYGIKIKFVPEISSKLLFKKYRTDHILPISL